MSGAQVLGAYVLLVTALLGGHALWQVRGVRIRIPRWKRPARFRRAA